MTDRVTGEASAKLNLFLRVLSLEQSGYHGIETLFCRVRLSDSIAIEQRGAPGEVTLDGPADVDLGPVEQNLAVRAAKAVLDATGRRFGVHITLEKRIPVAAGLGGGSADAAAALSLVNQLAGNAVPRSELFHFAARLGADVPFALSGSSLAIGWGHGERLLRLPALPSAPVLLLTPRVGVQTAEAYRWVDAARHGAAARGALALDLDSLSRWSDVARMAGNDFESAVFGQEPAVREAFDAVARTGPMLCRMTGSGSTIFGVYRTARERDDARLTLGKKLGLVTTTETT